MSLAQFLRILAARKAIILATLIACFFAATVTVFLLPPRYEAHNRVRVDITKPDPLTGQMSQQMMNAYLGTQVNLITDVQTAGLVVDDLGWATDPANQAAFEAAGRPGGDIRDCWRSALSTARLRGSIRPTSWTSAIAARTRPRPRAWPRRSAKRS
jgi:hypothetical protein